MYRFIQICVADYLHMCVYLSRDLSSGYKFVHFCLHGIYKKKKKTFTKLM